MKRSQEILGCIHPRLTVLNENILDEDFCDLTDLQTFPGSNTSSDLFDAGFATVQDIIESFRNDKNQDDRFVKLFLKSRSKFIWGALGVDVRLLAQGNY